MLVGFEVFVKSYELMGSVGFIFSGVGGSVE